MIAGYIVKKSSKRRACLVYILKKAASESINVLNRGVFRTSQTYKMENFAKIVKKKLHLRCLTES